MGSKTACLFKGHLLPLSQRWTEWKSEVGVGNLALSQLLPPVQWDLILPSLVQTWSLLYTLPGGGGLQSHCGRFELGGHSDTQSGIRVRASPLAGGSWS